MAFGSVGTENPLEGSFSTVWRGIADVIFAVASTGSSECAIELLWMVSGYDQ